MKIHVAREDLLTALQRVQGVVEKRNTMLILANILLEVLTLASRYPCHCNLRNLLQES